MPNSTNASLKEYFKDTADFLEILRHWWDIVNSSFSVLKANIKRNEWRKPIKQNEHCLQK